jgi:hypothetical protein
MSPCHILEEEVDMPWRRFSRLTRGSTGMSKKLLFACSFADGSAVRMRVDLRELRQLSKDGIFDPGFEYHHGKLPPPNELQDWAVQAFVDLSSRARREFTALTPLGILWRFAPAKKPQKVEISPLQAILMATATRGWTWQSITFANGSRGVWRAVFSTTPGRIAITIFGPLPGDEEIRAWLTPLLTIRGAKEAFLRWPFQDADPDGALVRIEFEHKPVAPAPGVPPTNWEDAP